MRTERADTSLTSAIRAHFYQDGADFDIDLEDDHDIDTRNVFRDVAERTSWVYMGDSDDDELLQLINTLDSPGV